MGAAHLPARPLLATPARRLTRVNPGPLKRVLHAATPMMHGPDVEGVGRALARAGYLEGIAKYMDKAPGFRGTYNASKRAGVNRLKVELNLPADGVYGERCHKALVEAGAFDAYACKLYQDFAFPPALCYPVAGPVRSLICQDLHETGGIPGNWAIDVCASPGSGIVAAERGKITHLSGHDPNEDIPDTRGVFGWSVYITTPKAYVYYVTHLGWRPPELREGLAVEPGDLIGKVGDQDFRPDHVHYGVSSPLGPADAKKRITAVVHAPRVS